MGWAMGRGTLPWHCWRSAKGRGAGACCWGEEPRHLPSVRARDKGGGDSAPSPPCHPAVPAQAEGRTPREALPRPPGELAAGSVAPVPPPRSPALGAAGCPSTGARPSAPRQSHVGYPGRVGDRSVPPRWSFALAGSLPCGAADGAWFGLGATRACFPGSRRWHLLCWDAHRRCRLLAGVTSPTHWGEGRYRTNGFSRATARAEGNCHRPSANNTV